MVPRTDIINIFIEDSFDDIISYTLNEQLTRYPVCKGNKDNVIGFIHIKDLYKQKIEGNGQDIKNIIREIKLVPESMLISELLKIFKKEKVQVALIIDEYGGTAGLVTIEDILEEIVGDFTTTTAQTIEQEVVQQSDGSMIIEGSANLRDLNKMFGWELDTEDARTFNGLILEHLEDIPDEGTVCVINGLRITILEVCDNMIKKAKVE